MTAMSLCKSCGHEHSPMERCEVAKKKRESSGIPFVATLNFDHETRVVKGVIPNSCPVCEARRLKNLEAVKRYRARKNERL